MTLVKLADGIYVNPAHVSAVRATAPTRTNVVLSDGTFVGVTEPVDDVARTLGYDEGPF